MRFDRILALYLFHPLRKAIRRPKGIRIPILMYHSISDAPETGHPYFRLNTSQKRFAEHMRMLKENDFEVISLTDAAQILETASIMSGKSADTVVAKDCRSTSRSSRASTFQDPSGSPQKYAVITFDDGFADFQTGAFPILREHGFCATVFLPTGFISDTISILKGKKCLRWSDVRGLARSGVRFGSHTVTHPKLKSIPWDQVEKELGESKNILEDRLGTEVDSFSYPYAFPEEDRRFRTRLRASLGGLGYTNGVTTMVGTASGCDDLLFLKRIPINTDDDPALFRAKLEGGYDWIHDLQYGFKVLKRPLNRTSIR